MEFLNKNFLDTTSMIAVNSNTTGAANILTRNIEKQHISTDFADDLTVSTYLFTFDDTMTVNRIALMGMNWKKFTVYHDGATASTFSATGGATSVTDYVSNSETSIFIKTADTACKTVSIDVYSTQVADSEKAIGYVLISSQLLDFEKIPPAGGYKPLIESEEIAHVMSDGGVRLQIKDRKMSAQIKLKYVSESFRNSLRTVHRAKNDFVFAAFPKDADWDEILFPCIWQGDFDFHKYSDNADATGFEGMIKLREIPS